VISRIALMTCDLVRAGGGQDDVELGLLLGLRGFTGRCGARGDGDGGRGAPSRPTCFEILDQLGDLDDREVGEVIDDLLLRDLSHDKTPSKLPRRRVLRGRGFVASKREKLVARAQCPFSRSGCGPDHPEMQAESARLVGRVFLRLEHVHEVLGGAR
jgi:hypothetical protein